MQWTKPYGGRGECQCFSGQIGRTVVGQLIGGIVDAADEGSFAIDIDIDNDNDNDNFSVHSAKHVGAPAPASGTRVEHSPPHAGAVKRGDKSGR